MVNLLALNQAGIFIIPLVIFGITAFFIVFFTVKNTKNIKKESIDIVTEIKEELSMEKENLSKKTCEYCGSNLEESESKCHNCGASTKSNKK